MVLLPRASSLMTMSATLMGLVVLLFSAREETVLLRASAVGGSLTSLTARVNVAESGVLSGREGSLTETLTAKADLVSKSRVVPALRKSSVPITSKLAASAPARVITLLPRASSLMTMSATLMRLAVLVFSAREAMVLVSASAVGGLLTKGTVPAVVVTDSEKPWPSV